MTPGVGGGGKRESLNYVSYVLIYCYYIKGLKRNFPLPLLSFIYSMIDGPFDMQYESSSQEVGVESLTVKAHVFFLSEIIINLF